MGIFTNIWIQSESFKSYWLVKSANSSEGPWGQHFMFYAFLCYNKKFLRQQPLYPKMNTGSMDLLSGNMNYAANVHFPLLSPKTCANNISTLALISSMSKAKHNWKDILYSITAKTIHFSRTKEHSVYYNATEVYSTYNECMPQKFSCHVTISHSTVLTWRCYGNRSQSKSSIYQGRVLAFC
jgi:hypothetical protein